MVFCYYSGHGIFDADLHVVLNDKVNYLFPIQEMLRVVASLKGTYIVSQFDCTRRKMDLSAVPGA